MCAWTASSWPIHVLLTFNLITLIVKYFNVIYKIFSIPVLSTFIVIILTINAFNVIIRITKYFQYMFCD